MRRLFILILLLPVLARTSAQETYTLKGEIFDEGKAKLNECYIKIISNSKTIGYLFTGQDNRFSTQLSSTSEGSLYIIIGKSGYTDTILSFKNIISSNPELPVKIHLKKAPKLLSEVTVTTPPVWKKGDTTFYRAQAFADGTEYKLGDIIKNMPGFKITDDGDLTYKNKPVEKITIGGEDLFSDRKGLLLANFPSDAIETIQALENQIDNSLLKGLTPGNKTIVNIGLKKNRMFKAFGTVDAGVNTEGRYRIAPVIFSLYGKTKFAFIANHNDLGYATTPFERDELQTPEMMWASSFMMPLPNFEIIPELAHRHYIRNNLTDTRFKINFPTGKKLKTETELFFNYDHWNSIKNSAQIVSGDRVDFKRSQETYTSSKPMKYGIAQKLKWQAMENQLLTANLYLIKIQNTGNIEMIQQLPGISDSVQTGDQDNNTFFQIETDYTNRINITTAIRININTGYQYYTQGSDNTSGNFPAILSLPSPNLNSIVSNRNMNGRYLTTQVSYLKKIKTRTISPSFIIDFRDFDIDNRYSFSGKENNLSIDSIVKDYTHISRFVYTQYNAQFDYGFRKWNLNWLVTSKAGIGNIRMSSPENALSYHSSIGELRLNIKKYRKKSNQEWNLGFNKELLHPREINPEPYPVSPMNFINYHINEKIARNSVSASYTIIHHLKNSGLFSALLFHRTSFNSFILNTSYNRLFQFSEYELINRPTSMQMLNISYSYFVARKTIMEWDMNSTAYRNLLKFEDKISRYNTYRINGSAKLEWISRKYNASLKPNIEWIHTKNKKAVSGNQFHDQFIIGFSIVYQYKLNKSWNIRTDVQYFNTQTATENNSYYFLANAALNYKTEKGKWGFSLYVDNITNSRYYETIYNSFPVSYSNKIPLIKRNVLVIVRYSF